MLILAGVSIATLTGENGILSKANDAKVNTAIGEEKDAIAVAYNGVMAGNEGKGVTAGELQDEIRNNGYTNVTAEDNGDGRIKVTFPNTNRVYLIDSNGNIAEFKPPITLEEAKEDSMLNETENTTVSVADGTVTVPAGFQIAQDSGVTIDEGIVIEDIKNNQFVWVPVSRESFDTEFVRRAGYHDDDLQDMTNYGEANEEGKNVNEKGQEVKESNTTVQEVKEMYASVKVNGGFYIGRYEAGRDSTDSNKVVIQKGADVYNNVPWSKNKTMNEQTETSNTQDGAIELARNFDTANGYKTVTSTLCYGVQWDRVISWIDPEYDDFAKNSTGMGWYEDNYKTGNPDHKTGIDLDDGKNMKNKIYDLAGNVHEWIMESNDTSNRVYRGGYYDVSGSSRPASYRYIYNPSRSYSSIGFRVTLYL